MFRKTPFIIIFTLLLAVLVLFIITAIIIYSPYYRGFEAELNYLSPDLSENRTVLRDKVYLSKKSVIKIVFEKKYNHIRYDRELYDNFIEDVEIQIWNDSEFFSFDYRDFDVPDINSDLFELKIGELSGNGTYFIYINADFGVNAAHHIGVGIGRERRFFSPGHRNRRFY